MPSYDLGTARGKIDIDTSNLNRASVALGKFGKGLLGVGALALAGFGMAVKASADFEKELSYFKAVSQATQAEMDGVRTKALQLGRDSAYGAAAVAGAFAELGKAGISAKEIVGGVADAMVTLAAAADIPLDESAVTIVQMMRTFSIEAGKAQHIADVLAGAANASTVSIEDLSVSMKYAGSVAAASGVSFEDTAAALAILGNAGIRGSTGGTSLRRMLLNLVPASLKAHDMMKELGIITKTGGNEFFTAAGKAKTMGQIAQVLHDHLQGLSDAEKVHAVNVMFGNRAVASALILARGGTKAFTDMHKEMGKVGALEVMNTRLDNLAGSLRILKSSLETALIGAGSGFQKSLKENADRLRDWVNWFARLDPATQHLIGNVVLLTGVVFTLAGVFVLFTSQVIRAVENIRIMIAAMKYLANVMRINKALELVKHSLSTFATQLKALGATLLTNPIFLIVAAIVALGVVLYELYKHWGPFHRFVDSTWQIIQKAWDYILGILKGVLNWVRKNWDLLLGLLLGPVALAVVAWRRYGDKITAIVRHLVGAIVGFFEKLPGRVVGALNALLKAAGRLAGRVVAAVVGFFQRLPGEVASAGALLLRALVAVLNRIPYWFGYFLGFALGLMLRILIAWPIWIAYYGVKAGIEVVKFLVQVVVAFAKFVPKAIAWIVFMGIGIVRAIIGFVPRALLWIGNMELKIIGILRRFVPAAIHFIVRMGIGILAAIAEFVPKAIKAIGDWITHTIHWISGLPGKAWRALSGIGVTLVTRGTELVKGFLDAAVAWVTKHLIPWLKRLPSNMVHWLGDLKDDLTEAGKNLVRGLWAGIKAMAGWIKDKVKDFAHGIYNGFKSGLGKLWPGSPSEAGIDLGRGLGSGIIKGLDAEQSRVLRNLKAFQAAMQINPTPGLTMTTPAGVAPRNPTFHLHFHGDISPGTQDAVRGAVMSPEVLKQLTNAARAGRRT